MAKTKNSAWLNQAKLSELNNDPGELIGSFELRQLFQVSSKQEESETFPRFAFFF